MTKRSQNLVMVTPDRDSTALRAPEAAEIKNSF